ncbi:hypothetical protein [Streptomyces sp. NPDC101776]|uniref:hypothetical protein n=1 Tax=Streptomyces sp. NPDC101776 TaxID=3366146 RepID=UPI0037FA4103
MFGGCGNMREHPICRLHADARIQRIYVGDHQPGHESVNRIEVVTPRGLPTGA